MLFYKKPAAAAMLSAGRLTPPLGDAQQSILRSNTVEEYDKNTYTNCSRYLDHGNNTVNGYPQRLLTMQSLCYVLLVKYCVPNECNGE